jgi:hypothetical protein
MSLLHTALPSLHSLTLSCQRYFYPTRADLDRLPALEVGLNTLAAAELNTALAPAEMAWAEGVELGR